MFRTTILCIAIAAGCTPPVHAQTGMPALNHSCPSSSAVAVTAKAGGPVLINGKQAPVKKTGATYFEASSTAPDITVSILAEPGGAASVSYSGPGKLNGICDPIRQVP